MFSEAIVLHLSISKLFMRFSYLIILVVLSSCFACSSNEVHLYVGTYTEGDSEGIYRVKFNTETGEFSDKLLVAKEVNPSFLALSPKKDFLYAVNEVANFNEDTSGSVVSFKVTEGGALEKLNKVSSKGAHPCHITVDESGKKIAVSNYSGGTVALYSSESGMLSEAIQVMDHNSKEEKSHVHAAQFSSGSLFVADLGRNAVYHYIQDGDNYKLNNPSIAPFTENSGPRHFILSEDGRFIYVIHEYTNAISVIRKTSDGFDLEEQVTTLEDSFSSESFCADIHFSKDERFVYGSNRGENTIVVFERMDEAGKLRHIQNVDVRGNWPRNFTLSPNGRFLLVANQKSNNISTFSIDVGSGKLEFVKRVDFPSPVCLLF